jgi:hypothetical protein
MDLQIWMPIAIHTDGGKEFINKIEAELYDKLDIKGTHMSPAHLNVTFRQRYSTKPWQNT